MVLEIQSITNAALRKAAEKADSQGENAYNGVLDENEVSLFLTNAKEAGCNIDEAQIVANKAKGSDVPTKVCIEDLPKLQNEIKLKEIELYNKKEELNKLGKSLDEPNGFLMMGSCLAAIYSGPVISGALEYYGRISHKLSMVIGGTLGALGGLGLAILTATLTKPNKNSYEYKVKENKIAQQKNEYYEKEIKPLEEEISKLKQDEKLLCQKR